MEPALPAPRSASPDGPAPRRADESALAWAQLARAAGLAPHDALVLALSGGADSCYLLELLAEARPRPRLLVAHVAHALRGAESEDDAAFCETRCAELGVAYERLDAPLEPGATALEERARRARYRALAQVARRFGARVILTGHHADDALETLLLRLARGGDAAGFAGPRARNELGPDLDLARAERGGDALCVVRPLLGLRREEVRERLRARGSRWREDTSNADVRFARNQVRHELVPLIERLGGVRGLDSLRSFARSIERFESELARHTAHLDWGPLPHAPAARPSASRRIGGRIARAELAPLPLPLLRRALWRLLRQGSGHAPSQVQVEQIADALARGRVARFNLRGAWHAWLRADELQLLPPSAALGPREPRAGSTAAQPGLPFPLARGARFVPEAQWALAVPGEVVLPDGRVLRATRVEPGAYAAHSGDADAVAELDAEGLPAELCVRWPRRGDRFHGLGAPGHKSLARFLSGLGVSREDRAGVPLVCADGEILWVVGLRPCERHKLRRSTRARLRLELAPGAPSAG